MNELAPSQGSWCGSDEKGPRGHWPACFKLQFWSLDSFGIPDDCDVSEKLCLLIIATGVVLPEQAPDPLLDATEMGKCRMEDFLSTKINTNELNFWDPLPMVKINTFSSAVKKIEVKATNDKIITLTADREFFRRLLVVAKQRDIDLQEVVSYELSAVPVAIAHGDRSLRRRRTWRRRTWLFCLHYHRL